jgi:ABC-type polysaccharide/polyol phosphate export permease
MITAQTPVQPAQAPRPARRNLPQSAFRAVAAYAHLGDFWHYREAVRRFATLNLKLRYSSTALGFLWSLANPIFQMLIFTFVFTVLTPSGITNFPVFVLSAILPWNFFQTAVLASIASITSGRDLILKLPFPREILPVSYVLSELVNFTMALVTILFVISLFGLFPGWPVLAIPILIVILVLFTAGVGLLLATVNVKLRDTQEFMGVFLFGWFFMTPIVYPLTAIPESRAVFGVPLRTVVQIANPMSAIVSAFRRIIYEQSWPDWGPVAVVGAVSLALFLVAYGWFRRNSAGFAEAI